MSERKTHLEAVESLDVVVVGAGISGINTAYRLQSHLPHLTFRVFEARQQIGGTWDLFKYPGIRSDSDLHTFGFAWHPWPHENPIAEGPLIKSYLNEAVSKYGIDKKIESNHKVVSADWSSKRKSWTIGVEHDGRAKQYTARFLILGTGYYDFETPLKAEIPGLENFKGKTIHPQFWPEDYDYSDKRIVIIGSGATAVTLLPNLAQKAAHVIMLQRSPTYIIARGNTSEPSWMRKNLPRSIVSAWDRFFFMLVPHLFYLLCKYFPNRMRALLRKQTIQELPARISYDPHFKPAYNPWEQRLCLAPDGDFYKSLHSEKADVVTSRIKTVGEHEIHLLNDRTLSDIDVIVTATGLRLSFGGHIAISTDGKPVKMNEKTLWNGSMVQDVPNFFYMMGYTNASWTLGADNTATLLCRLFQHMERSRTNVVVPRTPVGFRAEASPLALSSTYIKVAEDKLPRCGAQRPWKTRDNFLADYLHAKWGDVLVGLELSI